MDYFCFPFWFVESEFWKKTNGLGNILKDEELGSDYLTKQSSFLR